ncbi:MAG: type II secretion system F family protein [Chloroflexi bacterium]|nr:type II secretion system F family protein [Chloroflexota bacterium]
MAIRYEAYTWSGDKVKGVLDADTEEAAYELLAQEELIPYKLKPVKPRRSLVQIAPSLFQPKPQDIIDFTRQVNSLLSSGIPLRRVLVTQMEQARNTGLKQALKQIIEDVENGMRLSEAFDKHKTVFPDYYIRLLRVGEATGGISVMLSQLADIVERRKAVKDKVKSAMFMPAITMVVALVAGVILMTFALPAVVDMLDEFGGELPQITLIVIRIADYSQAYGVFVLIGMAVLGFVSGLAVRTAIGASVRDYVALHIPIFGGVIMKSNLFSLTTNMVTLLEAGVPVIESLRLTEQSTGNTVIKKGLNNVIENASQGVKLGQAFSDEKVFPSLLSQAIAIGELRGSVVDTLRGLSNYYEQQTNRAVSGMTEMVQPVITVVIAVLVGFVAVAVISGIYSTITSIE